MNNIEQANFEDQFKLALKAELEQILERIDTTDFAKCDDVGALSEDLQYLSQKADDLHQALSMKANLNAWANKPAGRVSTRDVESLNNMANEDRKHFTDPEADADTTEE